jgi:hypothetical protein
MEIEKFHALPPANWRPRNTSDVILPKCESPKTRGAEVLPHSEGRRRPIWQLKQVSRKC